MLKNLLLVSSFIFAQAFAADPTCENSASITIDKATLQKRVVVAGTNCYGTFYGHKDSSRHTYKQLGIMFESTNCSNIKIATNRNFETSGDGKTFSDKISEANRSEGGYYFNPALVNDNGSDSQVRILIHSNNGKSCIKITYETGDVSRLSRW